jgi:hypothetical protein
METYCMAFKNRRGVDREGKAMKKRNQSNEEKEWRGEEGGKMEEGEGRSVGRRGGKWR